MLEFFFSFDPMDNGEPLRVFKCESYVTKVVFWDKLKGG